MRRLVYLRRGGELVEAAGRKVQIRRQIDVHDRREHAVDQSTEHRTGERVGQVADDDVFVEQRDKHRGDLIADEAELEQEELHLIAICLPLAQIERLHHAELGIFAQVQHGERVAVGRDDAGDDEKHRPQEDENALDDGEQESLFIIHCSLLIINYHEEVCLEYHSQSDHRCCYRHRRGLRPASLPIVLASLPHPFPLPKEDNLPKRGHPLPRRTVFLKGPASPQRAGNGSPSGLSGRCESSISLSFAKTKLFSSSPQQMPPSTFTGTGSVFPRCLYRSVLL